MAKKGTVSKNYYDLSGGMNAKTSPLYIKDNECEVIVNYTLDTLGSLSKRNGISYLIGQIVDTKSINGLYFFKDSQGTDYSNVLAVSDVAGGATATIFKISSNAWANSKTSDTASKQTNFASFLDYVFRVNGADVMGSSVDLSTWGTTNCLGTAKPKFIWVWEDRLYAGSDQNAPNKSRIFWSELPSSGTITWGTNNWADINPDDNDEITWCEPFGTRTLIFKNKAVYRWTFGQVEPDIVPGTQGTPQGLTVKQTAGFCFFANEYGVYAYSGSGIPKLISNKVKPYIDAITDFTALRAEVDNDHYYLYIGSVTVGGKTWSNAMLVYTISANAWHLETYPFAIKFMSRLRSKTLGATVIYDSVYLGDNDGFVYRKGTGFTDYNGTTATPISGYIRTKEYALPSFPRKCSLKKMFVVAQKATGSKISYFIDRGITPKEWENLVERVTEGRIAGEARTLQLSIANNSLTDSQIEGFTFEVEAETEQREKING